MFGSSNHFTFRKITYGEDFYFIKNQTFIIPVLKFLKTFTLRNMIQRLRFFLVVHCIRFSETDFTLQENYISKSVKKAA